MALGGVERPAPFNGQFFYLAEVILELNLVLNRVDGLVKEAVICKESLHRVSGCNISGRLLEVQEE